MKYYKITNEEECHNGLQYQDGYVKDILPFNPTGDCRSGGIYFASDDILWFLGYGVWIREVIPIGQVYQNPGTPVKYKCHEVVLGPRRRVDGTVVKELIAEGCDANNKYALEWASENGHLDIVKELITNGCDANNEKALEWASENGHLDAVKELIASGCEANNEDALESASRNGHLDIVKELIASGCEAENKKALKWASRYGHLDIVKELITKGCEPDNKDALELASGYGHIEVVKHLKSFQK